MDKISKTKIRKIGENIKKNNENADDIAILNTYRNTHILVTNTLINTIKDKTPKPLFIARRLKRLSSIRAKLQRFSAMGLDRMQDIGGVRAVFGDMQKTKNYAQKIIELYDNNKRALKIIKIDDYITNPKPDGYRSFHIVFEYAKGKDALKGYRIEFQIRSLPQHYWATAVEIFSLISESNLKLGQGEREHKRFFYLASKILHNEASDEEIKELIGLDKTHQILSLLGGVNLALSAINTKEKNLYCVIWLDFKQGVVSYTTFHKNNLEEASLFYEMMEQNSDINAVLVDIESIRKLKKAYPNYFGDANHFIQSLKQYIK
ncbi:hypothetical protein BKN38_00225 [Helicobacter sp. CLO-3]|uniref:RelA/SpoT domain-containing protein n=1 Tax=unclassified Helicobacter TaxID=2593540 RepID=UPI0008060599|nr:MULTISPECIES: RelA/SpoT domain-containing protein [unclassified Helicobacter]OBV30033.1 hypothetical protein BA723_03165 [Helicobacter sp. CLO-3]OHU85866.1 hypothetical protein BKN38_00225 [Helicobacter sp. CLO-3]